MSAYERKSQALYRKARVEFLTEHPTCQCVMHNRQCRMKATQIHHKRGRGKDLCNKEFFMAVCGQCHNHIEINRTWAKEMGYLINRAASYVIPTNPHPHKL